jgi:hypothetical protein
MECNVVELGYMKPRRGILEQDEVLAKDTLTKHLREPRANCHRVGLLAPRLRRRGARIIHILPNGRTMEFDESAVRSIW